jgi:transposase
MSSVSIIPAQPSFRITGIHEEDGVIWFDEVSVSRMGQCPACGQPSTRTAGWVTRKPWTTPWHQQPTRRRIRLRRFCCDNPACSRKTFVERLPDVAPRQRRTTAFVQWVLVVAWVLSAELAAAVARAAGYPVSPDTCLRWLRRVPLPEPETPRVIGVDDWALRKGHRYGTVVVDLESHRILDVLPDRRAETLAAWLAAHPGVQVVSRDRSGAYAQGIATGAPNAQQVADRWHLLQNLGTAVDAWLAGWRPPAPQPELPTPPAPEPPPAEAEEAAPVSPAVARRRARWEAMHRLRAEGATVSAIARKLGLDRGTVRAYLAQTTPPGPPPPRVRGRLAAWFPRLERWYADGARTGKALWERAQAAGFPGSRSTIYAWLQRWHPTPRRRPTPSPPPATAPPWLRQACCQPWDRLPRAWDRLLSAWLAADATFRRGWTLVRHFGTLVRHRCGRALAAWVRAAEASGIPALAQFARSLRQDWAAVQAAVREPWSQGPVEAAVTSIKRLRRLMQGRGRWDLVRRRILHGLRLDPVPGQAS